MYVLHIYTYVYNTRIKKKYLSDCFAKLEIA
jgi:hypothetical protein